MQGQQDVSIKNRLSQKISSLSLDKNELKKLCEILQERFNGAADLEIKAFARGNQTDEEFENNKKTLQECFELKVTISGTNGEELYGATEDVFNSPNFPDDIETFYVNSETILRAVHNYYPRNSFNVFLQFSKPKILDFSFMPSQSTPNESKIEVQGYDATWTNGVFNEITNYFQRRSTSLSIVHNHSIYDVLLWVLGFPFAFWVSFKASSSIETIFSNFNPFVKNAVYLYIFIATLFGFRILFHYLRWVCPLVEYRSPKNKILIHRAVLATLFIGVFGAFIHDVIKYIF